MGENNGQNETKIYANWLIKNREPERTRTHTHTLQKHTHTKTKRNIEKKMLIIINKYYI